MQIQQIIDCLESRAPRRYQEDYDNSGLLTGRPEWELTGVLLTLDVTEAVLREASEKKCNLIVAHHPILFRGIKRLTGANYVERILLAAVKNDIALYAAHTNLDNVLLGVNHMIAERLGLVNRQVLAPRGGTLKKLYTFAPRPHAEHVRQALFGAGAGQIGRYSEASYNSEGYGTYKAGEGAHPFLGKPGLRHQEPETKIEVIFPMHIENQVIKALLNAHPYEEVAYDIVTLDNRNQDIGSGLTGDLPVPMDETEFLAHLKTRMETDCIRYTALLGKKVKKVALCGGAGSFLLPDALRSGADCYVSADFKYHEFFDADNHIVIADIGHFESEQFTTDIFNSIITEKFPNFAPLKSGIRTNPINYLH